MRRLLLPGLGLLALLVLGGARGPGSASAAAHAPGPTLRAAGGAPLPPTPPPDAGMCAPISINTVDGQPQAGASASVLVGRDGLGLIVYAARFSELMAAHCADSACTSASLALLDNASQASWISAAFGADGRPLISYFDAGYTNRFKVVHCLDPVCSSATVTMLEGPGVGSNDSLAIGADGLGLISYYDGPNGDLKVAHCLDIACSRATTATLDRPGDVGRKTALVIGADGLGLIAYQDVTRDALKVAHCLDVACSAATTLTLDQPAEAPALVLGPDGHPLLAYVARGGLTVAHCADAACGQATFTTFEANRYGVVNPVLAISADGLPLISYLRLARYSGQFVRKVAHCTDVACTAATLATVFNGEITTGERGLAVGADGLPLLAFWGGGLATLHCGSPLCLDNTSWFSDVQPPDYFNDPVVYLACRSVLSGYADGTLRPYAATTRAQVLKIVTRGFGLPISVPPAGGYTFADVPPAAPFFPYVETAAAAGIAGGYACGGPGEPCDSHNRPYLRPGAAVTRGQLAKFVVTAAGWPLRVPAAPGFADVAPGAAFYPFVETAACRGVLGGYGCGGPGEPCDPQSRPYFRPASSATRGQIAKIVYLALTAPGDCAAATPPVATPPAGRP